MYLICGSLLQPDAGRLAPTDQPHLPRPVGPVQRPVARLEPHRLRLWRNLVDESLLFDHQCPLRVRVRASGGGGGRGRRVGACGGRGRRVPPTGDGGRGRAGVGEGIGGHGRAVVSVWT